MTASSSLRRQVRTLAQASLQRARLRVTTLLLVGLVIACGGLAWAWFEGVGNVPAIFAQLEHLQQNPPWWADAPRIRQAYLIAPTGGLLGLALLLMKLSPEPRRWSRLVVASLLLALTLRYLAWRTLATLNFSTVLNGLFSLGLFGLELLIISGNLLMLVLLLRTRDRHRQADQLEQAVTLGRYTPSVDIFIPTLNEPLDVLRRTLVGCQAMDYPQKTVWLLDDGNRPEVKGLCQALGCCYLSRAQPRHAKAGNLNDALRQTQADLIAVFDADFIPTSNFLQRTVGFFQDERIGLVQTPQSFYNPDAIAVNLDLAEELPSEQELFFRYAQPLRDSSGSVVCAGTSFVVQRQALEAVGGFVMDTLSEDYFTGICLDAAGYRVIYLDEKLSAGLAAENTKGFAVQRLRWCRGTLQGLFLKVNPLTIPGLRLGQRLGHLAGLLGYFTNIAPIPLLLMPMAVYCFGVIPIRANPAELLFFFLPYYLFNLAVFSWLNRRSRSALLSDIYALPLALPLTITIFSTLLAPFGRPFQVTPKGVTQDQARFNWTLGWPLLLLFGLNGLGLWLNLGLCWFKGIWGASAPPNLMEHLRGLELGWIWSAYNLITLGTALLALLDRPRPSATPWLAMERVIRLSLPTDAQQRQAECWGVTLSLSESGAVVRLSQAQLPSGVAPGTELQLELVEANLKLPATVQTVEAESPRNSSARTCPVIEVAWSELSLVQLRPLIQLLYCRPGQWLSQRTPNELISLWLLLKVLLLPPAVFRRGDRPQVRAA
jgi:cellulose synthase (UDP-forming)